jgi:HlyD family secretion protein
MNTRSANMTSRVFKAFLLMALGAIIAVLVSRLSLPKTVAIASTLGPAKTSESEVTLASSGRVEGSSETTLVGAAADGVLGAVLVREGEKVQRGSVIANIQCADLGSVLDVTLAEAEAAIQARARLIIGSRDEERRMAAQKTQAALAVLEQMQRQFTRMQNLAAKDAVATVAVDESRRNHDVAVADLKTAEQNEQLVNAPPMAEDLRRADANARAAKEQVAVARERVDKCTVRAPIDGTILRVFARSGESFSTLAPRPIVSMANLSRKRVRAEIDERDIGKISVGQRVIISADAYGSREFAGTVERVATVMGRKTVESGDPAEKSDRDILEALIGLDAEASALPVGLRVVVRFTNTLAAIVPPGRVR